MFTAEMDTHVVVERDVGPIRRPFGQKTVSGLVMRDYCRLAIAGQPGITVTVISVMVSIENVAQITVAYLSKSCLNLRRQFGKLIVDD